MVAVPVNKLHVPPGVVVEIVGCVPIQKSVYVNVESSTGAATTVWVLDSLQIPTVYSMVYEFPVTAEVISPVAPLITAPSPGGGLKANVQPPSATS